MFRAKALRPFLKIDWLSELKSAHSRMNPVILHVAFVDVRLFDETCCASLVKNCLMALAVRQLVAW
jgi:hypothetical protein